MSVPRRDRLRRAIIDARLKHADVPLEYMLDVLEAAIIGKGGFAHGVDADGIRVDSEQLDAVLAAPPRRIPALSRALRRSK